MVDPLRRQAAENAIGGKTRLRDFDGVGDKTLRDLRSSGFRGLDDIQNATVDDLSRVDGIGEKRAQQIKQQAPQDTSQKRSSGSVSAAGIRVPTGEFKTEIGDKDKAEARFSSSLNRGIGRSQEAARADKAKRAPVTTDFDKWKNNKSGLDFPGVDTPSDDPKVLPRDYARGGPIETVEPDDNSMAASPRSRVDASSPGNDSFLLEDQVAAGVDGTELRNELFGAEAQSRDVSLSPGEAFDGVGAAGIGSESRGDIPVTDQFGRFDKSPEEEAFDLDQIAAENQASDITPGGELVEEFNDGNIGLRELGEGLLSTSNSN